MRSPSDKLKDDQKESSHRRLRMIKNLDAMLENDLMHDYQKFRLAELYLSRLVEGGDEAALSGRSFRI